MAIMLAVIQRVLNAAVDIADRRVAEIGPGLLVLVCVQPADDAAQAQRLVSRLLKLRVFADAEGRFNHSLEDTQGGLLLVPQFTLAADLSGGHRPSFSGAAPAEQGRKLFEALVAEAQQQWPQVGAGVFGADMQVSLVNDGPVTLWLELN
jgi:D-tyrosyl-tRNA(Tyr) deacylase